MCATRDRRRRRAAGRRDHRDHRGHRRHDAGLRLAAPPTTYAVHVTEDVLVTMSDGTVLRVNVYRPARGRRFPRAAPVPGRPHADPLQQVGPASRLPQRLPGAARLRAGRRRRPRRSPRASGRRSAREGAARRRRARAVGALAQAPVEQRRRRPVEISPYAAINQFLTAAQHAPGLKAMFPIVPAGDVYRDVVTIGQVDQRVHPVLARAGDRRRARPPDRETHRVARRRSADAAPARPGCAGLPGALRRRRRRRRAYRRQQAVLPAEVLSRWSTRSRI